VWRPLLVWSSILAGCGTPLPVSVDGGASGPWDVSPVSIDGEVSLVAHALWEEVDRSETPFAEEGAGSGCDRAGFGVDHDTLEIETGLCPALDVRQPSLTPVVAGDALHIIAYHLQLASPEGEGQAHLALALGESVVWEVTIPIPSPATPYDVLVPVTVDAPAGTPVHFHVHNHGYNSYNLQSVWVVTGP
jgi:hypothetical protein